MADKIETMSYEDLVAEFKKDSPNLMVRAADSGLNTSQLLNRMSPETMVEQERSVVARILQDENLYMNGSDYCAPSLVSDFLRSEHTHSLMYDYLHRISQKPYRQFQKQRSGVVASGPVNTPTNVAVTGSVTVDTPLGMTLNPAELVADSTMLRPLLTNLLNGFTIRMV